MHHPCAAGSWSSPRLLLAPPLAACLSEARAARDRGDPWPRPESARAWTRGLSLHPSHDSAAASRWAWHARRRAPAGLPIRQDARPADRRPAEGNGTRPEA